MNAIRGSIRSLLGKPESVLKVGSPSLKLTARVIPLESLPQSHIQSVVKRMSVVINNRMDPLVGLAAPQLGESISLIAYKDKSKLTFLANPQVRVIDKTSPQHWESEYEFCASLPHYSCLVARPNRIQVTGFDLNGDEVSFKTDGFLSRLIQHEVDHLHGLTIVDQMVPGSLRHDELA